MWSGVIATCRFYWFYFQLLKYVEEDPSDVYCITEAGILHQMMKNAPNKTLIPAPPNNSCACNDCPYMKLNTLEKVYLCLKYELPEITMDEALRLEAKKPMDKMMEMSKALGL